jgi:hypothetical protein
MRTSALVLSSAWAGIDTVFALGTASSSRAADLSRTVDVGAITIAASVVFSDPLLFLSLEPTIRMAKNMMTPKTPTPTILVLELPHFGQLADNFLPRGYHV